MLELDGAAAHREASPMAEIKQADRFSLIGLGVRCASGELLGRIKAVRNDDSNEQVSHVVVSFGSAPRIGEDCRVVPIDMLVACDDAGCLGVNVAADVMHSAPIYTRSQNWSDATWCERVAKYFASCRSGLAVS